MHEARLNGRPVGELAINAALAGTFGVPVALVSGDQALAAACRLIREGTMAALARTHAPLRLAAPVHLEVDFALTQMADMAELVPGSVRTAGRTVAFKHQEYREVFRAWRALYNLAGVASRRRVHLSRGSGPAPSPVRPRAQPDPGPP